MNHPNVVRLEEVLEIDGAPLVVMELLDGESLAERLDREGALPLASFARIDVEVGDALSAAHRLGIVRVDVGGVVAYSSALVAEGKSRQAPLYRPNAIAVIGPGAIGSSVAFHLVEADRHDVIVCARAAFDELVVEVDGGEKRAAARVVTSARDAGRVDWALLATKAHQTEGARQWLETFSRSGARVAILQNGVEHEARVRPFAGDATLVPVVVSLPADRLGLGHARLRGAARLTVRDDEPGRAFASLFEGTAITVDLVVDFVTVAWTKLCFNVAGGALTAITGQPNGLLRRPDVAAIARGLMLEAIDVGRAEGARLEDDLADRLLSAMQRGSPDAAPSILQDRRAGRPLEHDARNGAVVRIGEKHSIPTPLNRMATALLAAISSTFEAG